VYDIRSNDRPAPNRQGRASGQYRQQPILIAVMLQRFLAKYLSLVVTLVGGVALSLESYLSLGNKSLCQTQACQAVGKYLVFSESLLVAGGAFFFWLLAIVLFFAGRYPARLKNFPLYLLALALAIDSSLIGFQFFTIQQKCILCLSVAALLAGIAIIYCFSIRSFVFLVCFALIWAGGFGVQAIMTMPPPQGAYADMVFFSTGKARTSFMPIMPTKQNQIMPMQLTLIMSMNCPHCQEVISFLGSHHIDTSVRLVSIDTDQPSLARLSLFLQQVPSSSNPFKSLHDIKEKASIDTVPISHKLKQQTQQGANFLNNLGITNIPVLITDYSNNEKNILVGTANILSFLDKIKQGEN